MSVYRPRKSPYFHFDFWIRGKRHHGSTGQTSKRAAEEWVRRYRVQIALGQTEDAGDLTLDVAAAKWFDECVAGSRDAKETERRLGVLVLCIGANVQLRDISGATITSAVQKRRTKFNNRRAVANATVNRDILSPLRSILRRARVWGARNMPEIAWKELFLKEAPAAVREYTDVEIARWMGELEDEEQRLALGLLLRYGMRFGELYFHPTKLDIIAKRVTITGRKAREYSDLTIPLVDEDVVPLGKLAATALAHGDDFIWSLDYGRLYRRIRNAGIRAGLGKRVIHGARHHAGTQIARVAGLHVAKRLLGHASITSTVRYAHAIEDDLRNALEKRSRNTPGQPDAKNKKPQKKPRGN